MREPEVWCDECGKAIDDINKEVISVVCPAGTVAKFGPSVDLCIDCWASITGGKTIGAVLRGSGFSLGFGCHRVQDREVVRP